MQKKSLLVIFMVISICLLPSNADANKAGAVRTILKGTKKATRSHYYEFSRTGMAASEFEKNYHRNKNQDSTYRNPLDEFRPIYADSSISLDSLNVYRLKNKRYPKDLAPYRDPNAEKIVDNEIEHKEDPTIPGPTVDTTKEIERKSDNEPQKDSVEQSSKNDTTKVNEGAIESKSYSNTSSAYFPEEKNDTIWIVFLGVFVFIALIIFCALKIFNKKEK